MRKIRSFESSVSETKKEFVKESIRASLTNAPTWISSVIWFQIHLEPQIVILILNSWDFAPSGLMPGAVSHVLGSSVCCCAVRKS